MARVRRLFWAVMFVMGLFGAGSAPQNASAQASALTQSVPRLVTFSGVVKDQAGKPRTGTVGITFAIYKDQEGGSPLWLETQNVSLDEQGHYTVLLGSTKSDGLPLELFTSGEPRWLGLQVQLSGEVEQPRVLLVSVPYALKAAEAETLGGMPASSFVLAAPPAGTVTSQPSALNATTVGAASASPLLGGSGTQNIVAKFDSTGTNVINSSITDNGTAVSTMESVGIGTATPGAQLDVQATTTTGQNALNSTVLLSNPNPITGSIVSAMNLQFEDNSHNTNLSKQPLRMAYIREPGATGGVSAFDTVFTSSSFIQSNAPYTLRALNVEGPNVSAGQTLGTFYGAYFGAPNASGTTGTVTNNFVLVTEAGAGNVGFGTTTPTQRLEVAGNLKISGGGNFLMFPDGTTQSTAGLGTITGITAGTGLTGGGSSGNVPLAINTSVVPQLGAGSNTFTGNMIASSFTGNGSGLSSVNALMLNGQTNTAFAQIAAGNSFVADQSISTNDSGSALSVSQSGTGDVLDVTAGSHTALSVDNLGNIRLNSPFVVTITNDTSTGTTANDLAKLNCTAVDCFAIKTATTDVGGVIGIVVTGAGTTGQASVALLGAVNCNFDGSVTAGDYVQISSTVAGDCHDTGTSYPTSGQLLGRVIQTATGAGLYKMFQITPEIRGF